MQTTIYLKVTYTRTLIDRHVITNQANAAFKFLFLTRAHCRQVLAMYLVMHKLKVRE